MKSLVLLLFLTIFSAATLGQTRFAQIRYDVGVRPSAAITVVTPAAVAALERDAFQMINAERSRAGMTVLKWNDNIAGVARLHSTNMAEYNFFSHKGLDGLMVDGRAELLHVGAWSAIGENIAFMKGFDDPAAAAVRNWLQSPAHKKNLLSADWSESGIGLAVTPDGKYYFTQVFIRN